MTLTSADCGMDLLRTCKLRHVLNRTKSDRTCANTGTQLEAFRLAKRGGTLHCRLASKNWMDVSSRLFSFGFTYGHWPIITTRECNCDNTFGFVCPCVGTCVSVFVCPLRGITSERLDLQTYIFGAQVRLPFIIYYVLQSQKVATGYTNNKIHKEAVKIDI